MSTRRQPAALEDLLPAIESVADQIKVLVSAIDDLRCEVEWQARNASSDWAPIAPAPESVTERSNGMDDEVGESIAPSPGSDDVDDSLLSAAGRLRAYEELLFRCRRGLWLDEFVTEDDFIIPVGLLFSVDRSLWDAVLDFRPAHVVGDSCQCEADTGAPYLLAKRTETEFLLRELTEEEARRLQELCLQWQAEKAEQAIQNEKEAQLPSQLGLF